MYVDPYPCMTYRIEKRWREICDGIEMNKESPESPPCEAAILGSGTCHLHQPWPAPQEPSELPGLNFMFDRLPLEIRQKIFFLAIRVQAGLYINDEPLVNLIPASCVDPDVKTIRGWAFFWGTKQMSEILPVSRQWHSEIEEVLFSHFTFCGGRDIVKQQEQVEASWCLDFLSARARNMIQRWSFTVGAPWNSCWDTDDDPIRLFKEHKEIAFHLPALNYVKMTVSYTYLGREGESSYIQWKFKERLVDALVSLLRPFQHVAELRIKTSYDLSRKACEAGVPLEVMVDECNRILQEERLSVGKR